MRPVGLFWFWLVLEVRNSQCGNIGEIIRRRPALQQEKASSDIKKMDQIDASAS